MLRVSAVIFLMSLFLVGAGTVLGSHDASRPLTVADSVESTKILYNPAENPALVSPDGKTFLVVLQRGDIARNGSWVELLLGSTRSIEAASHASVVARLFSESTARASELIQNVRWLADNQRVVFLWDDGKRTARIVCFDTKTRRLKTLVQHFTPIVEYDIGRDGQTIIFLAQSPRNKVKEAEMEREGFAVTDQPLWSILRGHFDGWTARQRYQTFVMLRPTGQPRRIHEPGAVWSTPPELLKLSPNTHYALSVRPAQAIPESWDAYTEHVFKDMYLPAAREDSSTPNYIRQYFLVDIAKGITRPLWNAPENPLGDVVWSPDSRHILIGPSFLPVPGADAVGLAGRAVVEMNIISGQFDCLSLPLTTRSYYHPLRWRDDGTLEISRESANGAKEGTVFLEKLNRRWTRIAKEGQAGVPLSRVTIQVRENPNMPPALYAVEAKGNAKLIRELNPRLWKSASLGRVEPVHWRGTDGSSWTGMLYYPVHYRNGRTFPLVIQTHGYSVRQFSLDGPFTTVFAAQELANRDIAVLQTGAPDFGIDNIVATPGEPVAYLSGFEGAIHRFVQLGLADPGKIGIIGFSRTGWLVEYMLTHSSIPLAAAEVADNIDGSYMQYVLDSNANKAFDEKGNGSRPFGRGVEMWAEMAPGFNADRVHTPLRMEVDSGPIDEILSAWEMFSNLRYLRRPVELFVIPDIQHGVHVLQNPRQRLASQGGTVDWFCYWLKGEVDPDPRKADQYARWNRLSRVKRTLPSQKAHDPHQGT